MTEGNLYSELKEARDRLDELFLTSFQNMEGALERYIKLFRPESPAGEVLSELLTESDFVQWYNETCDGHHGGVGSGKLDWPPDIKQRVYLQYHLLEGMCGPHIDLDNFAHMFTYVGPNINDNNTAFIEQVIVPFHNDVLRLLTPAIEAQSPNDPEHLPLNQGVLVDLSRIAELESIDSVEYDFSKVIQLCIELNSAYKSNCFYSVAALTRALIDHVPPLFGCEKFSEVSNNYGGSKSFQQSMKHLQNSARSIGDAHLHTQIRNKETLPTLAQVNFNNDIDVLLSEIVRLQK